MMRIENSKIKEEQEIKRKCIVTGLILARKDLYRFSKHQGKVSFDPWQNLPGRGAYCQKDQKTLKILFTKKRLNRTFRMNITNEEYNELKKEVNYGEEKSPQTQKQYGACENPVTKS